MVTFLTNPILTTPGLPSLNSSPTQIRNFIICARKRRRQPFLNRKAIKLLLDTSLAVASNLNLIPPTVTSLIHEFGAGGRGGHGSRRSGGGGGGGGGGFGWWRRRARNLGFVALVVMTAKALSTNKKVKNDVVLYGIVLAMVGGSVGFGDWILRLCCCAGVVYLLWQESEQVRRSITILRARVTDSLTMKQLVKKGFKSKPF